MYLRTVTTNGVKYVQLAHSYRDPQTGVSKVRVLQSLGRADHLDVEGLKRLVGSICRYLEPYEGKPLQPSLGLDSAFEFVGSRELGVPWVFDGLWSRLGIRRTLESLLSERDYETAVERLVFAMVLNRAMAPSSKLAMEDWVSGEVTVKGLPTVEVHQLYRAMDFLLESAEEIQRNVFSAVANLFNLEVDVIFFDTTTTYFEVEGLSQGEEEEFRRRGYSKDDRPDLGQIVVGFAMTRDGIPVRVWAWPGNTSDQNVVEEVKKDLNGWKLGRVVTVMDAGFNSTDNRRVLQGAADGYIIGEKMRTGRDGEPADAAQRAGAYKKLACGLEAKEVVVGDGATRRRFIVVRNPDEAERDEKRRADMVGEVTKRLEELRQLRGEPHTKAACALRSHPVYGRYIRQSKTGTLSLDKGRVKRDARLDGKYLISTSEDSLPVEEVVSAYKNLWRIERLNRDLKHLVDIRPVYHRLEDRVRSHVLLCWLALLLIRVAENETKETWRQLRLELSKLKMGIHRTQSGEVRQSKALTEEQKKAFAALQVQPPPRYLSVTTAKTPRV
jgi:transposase